MKADFFYCIFLVLLNIRELGPYWLSCNMSALTTKAVLLDLVIFKPKSSNRMPEGFL